MFEPNLPLTLYGAQAALMEGLHAIATGQTTFDLSRIDALDSAAVAILLAWRRAARAQGKDIDFRNPPPALCSLAALYDVAGLLHVAQPAT